MKIVFYGLTITSSWGNGHATTYRSLCKALTRRGHSIHFVEKDVKWYRNHRDLPDPEFCEVHLYDDWTSSASRLLQASKDADVVVIGSCFPDAIEATDALLDAGPGSILFYDMDTPATLAELRSRGRTDYLDAAHIPHYAAYLSFSGGPALRTLEDSFGSPRAVGFYCSVDPSVHSRTTPQPLYRCNLSYLGTYAPDRQRKLMHYLNGAARLMPLTSFVVAGPQYPESTPWRPNVRVLDHVPPSLHPAFYSSCRFTLNLTRSEMVNTGFSPSVRLFEASACGVTILSDAWPGMAEFLTPGKEILLPRDEYDVARILRDMPEEESKRIGRAAQERILDLHTADHRALEFEAIVNAVAGLQPAPRRPRSTWDGQEGRGREQGQGQGIGSPGSYGIQPA
jgi:spore maturation protein CgeB